QRVFQVHVERAAVCGGLEGADASRRRAEFDDEAHVAAVEELVDQVLLVLELLAILGENLALLGLLGIALEDEAEANLVDDRAVLVQHAVELAQERVFRADLAGRKEDGLHAAVNQRLDRRLERLVRGAIPELEEIEIAALGVEVEA